jgi:microcystin-dependent protein
MTVDPREYIEKDRRLPTTLSADAGKMLVVNAAESAYEHAPIGATGTGEIFMWPFDTPPSYGLMCNGAVKNVNDYPALGAKFGGVAGGTFTLPTINFAKNSLGVNTNTVEAESVGTHGHAASSSADHTHTVTVTSIADHSHDASSGSAGDHTHSTGGGSRASTPVSSASPRDIVMHYGGSTGSAGGHSHSVSVSGGGAHTHVATADAGGGFTPVITDHSGTNQPACTLLNFCIRI